VIKFSDSGRITDTRIFLLLVSILQGHEALLGLQPSYCFSIFVD